MGLGKANLMLSTMLLGAVAAGGCSSSQIMRIPRPARAEAENRPVREWVSYIQELDQLCSEDKALKGEEERFTSYLSWLSTLAGQESGTRRFRIIPDSTVEGVFEYGPLSLFTLAGIYWHGDVIVRDSRANLALIAHEFGHGTDKYLNNTLYVSDRKARVRMEAVAEAFKGYALLELVGTGNTCLLDEYIGQRARIYLREGLEETIESQEAEHVGADIALLFTKRLGGTEKAWRFLANEDVKEVYSEVNELLKGYASFEEALKDAFKYVKEEAYGKASEAPAEGR